MLKYILAIYSLLLFCANDSSGRVLIPNRIPASAITIVSIKTQEDETTPSRKEIAKLINILSEEGAKIIVFDILFDRPAADDIHLINSIKKTSAIVIFPRIFSYGITKNPHKKFEKYIRVGDAEIIKDKKGAIKKFYPYMPPNRVSVAYLAAMLYLGYDLGKSSVKPYFVETKPGEEYVLAFENYRLDISSDKSLGIVYIGGENFFVRWTSDEVLNDNYEKGYFKDKLVIVDYVSETFEKKHKTPVGELSFAEVIANQIYTIWQLLREVE